MNPRSISRFLYIVVCFIFCMSCSKANPLDHVKHLDGYWEIKKVILPNGEEKEYKFSQLIDFFEIKDSTGVHKKVQPKIDGSFITTNTIDLFTFKAENDSLRLYYKTPYSSWKETVISATENQMVIKNETGNVYFYQRYQKIQL